MGTYQNVTPDQVMGIVTDLKGRLHYHRCQPVHKGEGGGGMSGPRFLPGHWSYIPEGVEYAQGEGIPRSTVYREGYGIQGVSGG